MTRRTTPLSAFDFLAERVSGLLDPSDREALCGDLAESGVAGIEALHDVLSLVIRRQIAVLSNFRPWVVLAFLAIPIGVFLSVLSRQTADGSAIYLWLYTSNLNLSLARTSGYWRGMAECLPVVLLPCLSLACLSWTAGLLIGVYARQTRWLSGGGLIGVLFCASILGLPHGFALILVLGRARDYFGNAAVFTNTFYRLYIRKSSNCSCPCCPSLMGCDSALLLVAFLVQIGLSHSLLSELQ